MTEASPVLPNFSLTPELKFEAGVSLRPLYATDATGATVVLVWNPQERIGGIYNFSTKAWTVKAGSDAFGPREFLDEQLAAGLVLPPKPERAPMDYGMAWVYLVMNPPTARQRLADS